MSEPQDGLNGAIVRQLLSVEHAAASLVKLMQQNISLVDARNRPEFKALVAALMGDEAIGRQVIGVIQSQALHEVAAHMKLTVESMGVAKSGAERLVQNTFEKISDEIERKSQTLLAKAKEEHAARAGENAGSGD